MKWNTSLNPAVSWLQNTLDDLPPETYFLQILDEHDGDSDLRGDLDEQFEITIPRCIDLNPEPNNTSESRTARERLVECARTLTAAYDRGAAEGHIEWDSIDEVHRLARAALRFQSGRP
ncbi:MAG: hypothetical protein ABIT01_20285 [Thermoanaerobaculia bacterium]